MSFDRMGSPSGAFPGALPRRSVMAPKFAGKPSASKSDHAGLNLADFSAQAIGPIAAANQSVAHQWADKTAAWGTQEVAADVLNAVTSPNGKAGKVVDKVYNKFGAHPKHESLAKATESAPKNYSNLLHLGSEQVSVGDLSWAKYKHAVQNNLSPFKQATQGNNIQHFFKDVTPKSYVKETVIQNNVKPIQDLASNNPGKQIGSGLLRTAALGLMGYDVLKHTRDTHQQAKAKEDGSFKSKMNTCKESAVALGKYTTRNVATWEAASVGAAVGKAILPIALGGVSLGGIAIGALAGLVAQKGLNRVLKTGDRDPVQQRKMQEQAATEAAS